MYSEYYRSYFLTKIFIILTLGSTWGLLILWNISQAQSFTAISIHEINAHGHAQIYGWLGLFIMGFTMRYMPHQWNTELAAARMTSLILGLMLAGIILHSVGLSLSHLNWAPFTALMGNFFEIIAITLFCRQMIVTFRKSSQSLSSYTSFFFMSLLYFFLMSLLDAWLTWKTLYASSNASLIWNVQTWQPPLRNLQIHGCALFMILGISLQILPKKFGIAVGSESRNRKALAVLTFAVIGEVVLYLTYRMTGNHLFAALLLLPWALLFVAVIYVIYPWKLWRAPLILHESNKFIKAAYCWLLLSLFMLLFSPIFHKIVGVSFSHAWYGATRHAIAVGFISLMIMTLSVLVTTNYKNLNTTLKCPALGYGPFLLVNLGCFLRVSLQSLSDWSPIFFQLISVSGFFEMMGLSWWAIEFYKLLKNKKHEVLI